MNCNTNNVVASLYCLVKSQMKQLLEHEQIDCAIQLLNHYYTDLPSPATSISETLRWQARWVTAVDVQTTALAVVQVSKRLTCCLWEVIICAQINSLF
jgi:hypothetical protein